MLDIYSMGNIFGAILVVQMPFEDQKESKSQKKVKEGIRPLRSEEVLESRGVGMRALLFVMKKCWVQKPGDWPPTAACSGSSPMWSVVPLERRWPDYLLTIYLRVRQGQTCAVLGLGLMVHHFPIWN